MGEDVSLPSCAQITWLIVSSYFMQAASQKIKISVFWDIGLLKNHGPVKVQAGTFEINRTLDS